MAEMLASRRRWTIAEHVGMRVRVAREEKGLTQATLGRMLKPPVTGAAVCQLEQGQTNTTIGRLYELGSILDRKPDWFILGTVNCPCCGQPLSEAPNA